MKIKSICKGMEYSKEHTKRLEALGEFENINITKASEDEIIEILKDTDMAIVGSSGVEGITDKVLNKLPNLKIISLLGAGAEFIDKESAKRHNILICNAKGGNSQSVAEHTFGMILSLSKRITESHISTKSGDYNYLNFEGIELSGKTIGIVGFGEIGSRVANIAKGFGIKIITYSRTKKEIDGVEFVELDELLKSADVIVATISLSVETENMFGVEEISKMKDNVIFVNPSREGLIEKDAFLDALEENKFFGFGMELDINEVPDERFYKYPNVLLTPHTAFFTAESEENVNNIAIENLEKFVKGEPQNEFN